MENVTLSLTEMMGNVGKMGKGALSLKVGRIGILAPTKRLTNEPTRRYENEFSSVQFY